MKTSTKIFAGLSSALILGGAGTATYFGIENNRLKDEHAQYVIAQEKKNEDLTSKIVDLQEALGDQEALKQELALAKASASKANADLQSLRSSVEGMQKELNQKELQMSLLSDEIDTKNQELEQLKADKTTLASTIEGQQQEIDTLTSQKATLTNQITQYQNELTEKETALAQANANLTEAQNSLTAKQTELDAKDAAIARLNAEIEALRNAQGSDDNEVQDASTYTTLAFTYNETEKTASVKGNDNTITSVEIPAKVKYNDEVYTVTEIGSFSRYMSLKSVTLPEGITTIKSDAFDMTTQIEAINIPASVTTIGEGAFARSTKTITVDAKNETFYAYGSGLYTKADNVLIWGCNNTIIKEGTTVIGKKAFYYCSSLTSINIPASVTSIGGQAFYSCGIKQITLPANLTNIGSGAFLGCSQLKMVTFENKVGWQVINTAGETLDISESNLSEENVMTTWGNAEGYEWKRTETTENADNGDSYTPGDLF